MNNVFFHPSSELLSLLIAHPTYPILYVYGAEGDYEGETVAEEVKYSLSHYLELDGEIYTSKMALRDRIEEWLWDSCGIPEEMTSRINKEMEKYEPLWQPIILVEVW
jgi:hypothetical protein